MAVEETFDDIVTDLGKHADETIGSVSNRFDFSLESIGLLDSLVDGLSFNDDNEEVIMAEHIGSYIGEVVARNSLGDWIPSSSEPEYPTEAVAIIKTKISIFDPFNWAFKRIHNGSEDALLFKFNVMVLNDRPSPKKFSNLSNETSITQKKKKGFWGRLFELP